MTWNDFLFSFEGRAGRRANLGFSLTGFFLMLHAVAATPPTLAYAPAPLIVLAILYWPWCAVGAKRLHDIGYSGWLQLICIFPFFGSVALFFASAIIKGNPESNEFGAPVSRRPRTDSDTRRRDT
jgi:uncharacterized membrane protein YhaH (DUF805 family)